jgi:hypothetical protein
MGGCIQGFVSSEFWLHTKEKDEIEGTKEIFIAVLCMYLAIDIHIDCVSEYSNTCM